MARSASPSQLGVLPLSFRRILYEGSSVRHRLSHPCPSIGDSIPKKMRAGGEELLCGYKERVRTRLQELMVTDGYLPSHPLVTATSLHLNLPTASEVAANYGASTNAVSYYQGCDLFYRVPQRPATPLSEHEDHTFLPDLKQAT